MNSAINKKRVVAVDITAIKERLDRVAIDFKFSNVAYGLAHDAYQNHLLPTAIVCDWLSSNDIKRGGRVKLKPIGESFTIDVFFSKLESIDKPTFSITLD